MESVNSPSKLTKHTKLTSWPISTETTSTELGFTEHREGNNDILKCFSPCMCEKRKNTAEYGD